MPNVMTAQPNIAGAPCESSVIPFRVPRRKLWLTPADGVPYSNTAKAQYRRTQDLDAKCILHLAKFSHAARAPENVYSVPARETAKHRAKFGWPPVSDSLQ